MQLCASRSQHLHRAHLVLGIECIAVMLVQGCINLKALDEVWVGQKLAPIHNQVGTIILQGFDAAGPVMSTCH